MEPHFERVAAQFQGIPDIVFLSADCDEDESLVPAYLEEEKPRTTVVFADGLDRLLAVNAFPTVVILDRTGKIAYRAEGFDPDDVEAELASAVRRVLAGQKENAAKLRSRRQIGAIVRDEFLEVVHLIHVFAHEPDRMRIHSLHDSQVAQHLRRHVILERNFQRHRRLDHVGFEIVQPA